MENTSYKRVLDALEHREPDRIPFDLGAAAVTGINIVALRNLKKYLGLKTGSTIRDDITQLADFDPDMAELFKTDVGAVLPRAPSVAPLRVDPHPEGGYSRLIDEFGIGWQMPLKGGLYYDQYFHPRPVFFHGFTSSCRSFMTCLRDSVFPPYVGIRSWTITLSL